MARREYTGAAPETALAAGITASSTSFTVDSGGGGGYPTGNVGPFFVVIDGGTASEEKILCASRTGDVFTVASGGRGADDTTAVSHNPPATVRHVYTATDADEANQHANTDAGVHGVAGNLVGDSDTQTLTNKTINTTDNDITVDQADVNGLPSTLSDHDSRITANKDFLDQFNMEGFASAPDPGDGPSSYPEGLSAMNAQTVNGWPENGILITWKNTGSGTDRTTQEVTEGSTGSSQPERYIRHWTGSSWASWRRVVHPQNAPNILGDIPFEALRRYIHRESATINNTIFDGSEGFPGSSWNELTDISPTGNWGGFIGGHSSQWTFPRDGLFLVTASVNFDRTDTDQNGPFFFRLRNDMSPADPDSGDIVTQKEKGIRSGSMGSRVNMQLTFIVEVESSSSIYGVTLFNNGSHDVEAQAFGTYAHKYYLGSESQQLPSTV